MRIVIEVDTTGAYWEDDPEHEHRFLCILLKDALDNTRRDSDVLDVTGAKTGTIKIEY